MRKEEEMKITRKIFPKAAREVIRKESAMETWDEVLSSYEVNVGSNKFLDMVAKSMGANIKKRMVTIGINNKKLLTDKIKVMSRKRSPCNG
ncbi:hypothetical protein QE152_g35971 [Popillia japonica]|uniref:Uncharacterized protein n=1 Tax=Popillia japonica TaxID=7064 RepID=A0AAW1IEM5_POPJA